jgi:hypothetical protein
MGDVTMSNSGLGRAFVGWFVLAAGMPLSACGGDGEREVQADADTSVSTRTTDVEARNVRVTVHMTGLVLVVPPKQGGDSVKVLLPDTQAVGDHVAWLGFGIEPTNPVVPRLCVNDTIYTKAGICYVDLDKWTLDPFGGGGRPSPPAVTLPNGVLNVTNVAGGMHKVHVPWLTNGLRAEVMFTAGRPGATCSLASWAYRPVDSQGRPKPPVRDSLVNVLDWEIEDPGVDSLVFRDRASRDSIKVSLPQTGEAHMILAHIPVADVKDLPPGSRVGPLPAAADSAKHFRAYYNLLRMPGTNPQPIPPHPHPRRQIPHHPQPLTTEACKVSITTPVERFIEKKAIGTYACMVASADPH